MSESVYLRVRLNWAGNRGAMKVKACLAGRAAHGDETEEKGRPIEGPDFRRVEAFAKAVAANWNRLVQRDPHLF